jgi:hypothetical protein
MNPAASTEMALHAQRLDFHSSIRERDYRLLISIPSRPAPSTGYPVVYLIDGNLHFGITVDTMRIQACWPDVRDAVIVGIGYPTDSVTTALQLRMDDLTTPLQPVQQSQVWFQNMPQPANGYGRMEDYLQMIDEEIKPRIAGVVPVDPSHQTLMGHSLGGLTTLHALLRRTESFQTYVAIAPSIWWNDREVLQHETAFTQRVGDLKCAVRTLISVGALESTVRFPRGHAHALPAGEGVFRQMTEWCRMVPNVEELGKRLARLNGPSFRAQTVVHEGDHHNMVPAAGIARGIEFALRDFAT